MRMSEAIMVALITGGLSLLGSVISGRASIKKTEQSIRTCLLYTSLALPGVSANTDVEVAKQPGC